MTIYLFNTPKFVYQIYPRGQFLLTQILCPSPNYFAAFGLNSWENREQRNGQFLSTSVGELHAKIFNLKLWKGSKSWAQFTINWPLVWIFQAISSLFAFADEKRSIPFAPCSTLPSRSRNTWVTPSWRRRRKRKIEKPPKSCWHPNLIPMTSRATKRMKWCH